MCSWLLCAVALLGLCSFVLDFSFFFPRNQGLRAFWILLRWFLLARSAFSLDGSRPVHPARFSFLFMLSVYGLAL